MGAVDYKNIPNYKEKADVIYFHLLTEGLPNVVLGKMSMKLTVILKKVDGNVELAQKIGSILI